MARSLPGSLGISRALCLIIGAAFGAGCAPPPNEAVSAEESALSADDELAFFDAHVHLNDPTIELASMERHRIERAVVFWGGNSDNESVLAAARAHPERFVPFASVSPERSKYRPLWQTGDRSLLGILDQAIDAGGDAIKGIGEISAVHFPSSGFAETEFDPVGPTMRGIMDIARRRKLPVMVHIELTRLRELDRLLADYRDVPVIWAHGGYTPLFLAERMLEAHPNLTYELSARTWTNHPRSPDYTILRDGKEVWPEWLALVENNPSRFVVGTDASQRSAASDDEKAKSVQRFLAQLSPAVRAKVARKNLTRLLGL